MSLKEIIGDNEVCRQLISLTDSRRLPHAVILESRDRKKTQAASKELAKISVCSFEGKRPCGVCRNCMKAEKDIHPDIYRVEITDKKQNVGVGEIREMISDAYIKPNEAAVKVYLINDKMTVEAQNALLKILEEPPQNVSFIITCESSAAVLKTVLSRSSLFRLNEDTTQSEDELDRKSEEIALEIVAAIPLNMEMPLLTAVSKFGKDKALAQKVFDKLIEYISQALEEKFIHEGNKPAYVSSLVRALRKKSLLSLLDVTVQAQKMLAQNCNMNLLATWYCAQVRQSRH